MEQKTLDELTIKNNFMFGAVMSDNENCKMLLDIFAKDENHTHYDIEMQVVKKPALGRRSRYYHSQLDMELLEKNADYAELPNGFVIFICDFDPFGLRKYRYWFRNCCAEANSLILNDGRETIFLSAHGENEAEVPEARRPWTGAGEILRITCKRDG